MQSEKDVDKTWENEAQAPKPMVQISLKEYDKLKENSKYITDKSLISEKGHSLFLVPSYIEMIKEMRDHMIQNKNIYNFK